MELKVSELCARYFFLGDLPNLTMMSSAVSSPLFTFSTAVLNAKPSLGFESIKRLRSAIGSRLSYCFRSSSDTFRALASLPEISSEGNRLPSSMSERKGEEMPTFFANPRKDKSALSRNRSYDAGVRFHYFACSKRIRSTSTSNLCRCTERSKVNWTREDAGPRR